MNAILARVIPQRIAPVALPWSVLTAAGAAFFASAAAMIVFTFLYRVFGVGGDAPLPRPSDLATIASLSLALAVAFVAGGRVALSVYVVVVLVDRVAAIGAETRFCAAIVPAPASCSFAGYVLGLWPYVLGAAIAYSLVRSIRSEPGDGNPLLEVAGALYFTRFTLLAAFSLLFVSANDVQSGLLQLLAAVAAGLVCGLVLMRRVELARQWRTLAIIGLVALGEWFVVIVPGYLATVGVAGHVTIGGLALIALFGPLVEIGAVALVLYMAAARKVSSAPA